MDPPPIDRTGVVRAPFGITPDGVPAEVFTLTNSHGVRMQAVTYGGAIVSLSVPDREGRLADVVLGHDSLEEYRRDTAYFGAIVGRFSGRIARAGFSLDGKTYRVTANDGPNHLHGGRIGFDRVVWHAVPFRDGHGAGVVLSHTSPDGTEGFPGTLDVRVTYTLTDQNELAVDFLATTDRPTPVNLTQHSYFNLAGEAAGDILGHQLWINAEQMTPVDARLIPTGRLAPVAGGPFDFRSLTPIGARIGTEDEQLRRGRGYDHTFVLNRAGPGLVHAARVVEPLSGRRLDVHTTEPGLHFYSGNLLDGRVPGKGGREYGCRAGLCLETQHYPDSPNQPAFPSAILRPGAEYRSRTVFVFGVAGQGGALSEK